MKRKLIRSIILGLTIILMATSVFTYRLFEKTKQVQAATMSNNQMAVTQQLQEVNTQVIIDKLNSTNSLNCLAGQATVRANYSNDNVSNQDINMKWLRNVLKGKSMEVTSILNFDFAYDLKDLDVTSRNGVVTIKLSSNRLSLLQCETCNITSKDKTGIFASFSPSETNSLAMRTQDLARNSIQAYSDFRKQAMVNVQDNIKSLLGSVIDSKTTIVFDAAQADVVSQDDVTILNYSLK